MDPSTPVEMMKLRAADARAIVISFTITHVGLALILGFGGAGLQDSGVQLALATWVVLGSLWCVAFLDDAMQDLMAAASDVPGFENSAMGKRLEKTPVVVVRVANVVVAGLIVLAELLAIY